MKKKLLGKVRGKRNLLRCLFVFEASSEVSEILLGFKSHVCEISPSPSGWHLVARDLNPVKGCWGGVIG